MIARYLNAPLLLLLWQVAPVDFPRDHAGRIRISLAGGGGDFVFRENPGYPAGVDCAGERYPARAPSTDRVSYTSAAIGAEVWARQKLRIHATYGGVGDDSDERQGSFFAFQAALEQKQYGVGLGMAVLGGPKGITQPSASARLGSLDGVSLRADYYQPQTGMALVGGPRIGVGWNQGRNRKPRLLVGLATTPIPDSAQRLGGFFELAVPVGFLHSGLSLNGFVSGNYQGRESKRIHALGLGVWVQP